MFPMVALMVLGSVAVTFTLLLASGGSLLNSLIASTIGLTVGLGIGAGGIWAFSGFVTEAQWQPAYEASDVLPA